MSKVIIFLVEGPTDERSLSTPIENFLEDYKIKFCMCRGDFTSDDKITTSNILIRIGELLKRELQISSLRKSDILKVVHIIDTDGAYVGETYMKVGTKPYFIYNEEYIQATDIELIKKRNKNKVQKIKKLLGTSKVLTTIPYEIFYFSVNLEHVLHNKLNLTSDEKDKLSREIEKKFDDDRNEFIGILNNEDVKVNGSYVETWNYLEQKNNSLKRGSNLHLYFLNLTK